MDYQTELNSHLARYKETELGVQEPGIFMYRNRAVQKAHILPKSASWQNLFPIARELVQRYRPAAGPLKLHRYFHHLNSSQAFALNLFFPYFEGGDQAATVLLDALGVGDAHLQSWEPEAVPHQREGTNLDMRCTLQGGEQILCEVKLSEREFGKAANDARHKAKLRDLYKPVLAPHVAEYLLDEMKFFGAYQILRNVWHLASTPRSRLLFVMPEANRPLWIQLEGVLAELRPELRSRVIVSSIESVLGRLREHERCSPELRAYAEAMTGKYVPRAF